MAEQSTEYVKQIHEVPRKKRTKKHRPALWECMLGTVEAVNDEGVVKYFDYNFKEALEYAGVSWDRDPRQSREYFRVFDPKLHIFAGGKKKWAIWIREV